MSEMDYEKFEDEATPQEAEVDTSEKGKNIDAMMRVSMDVRIVLGETKMPVAQVLKLGRGAVIELDKKIGEPVEVMIHDRVVARGNLVKVSEGRLGVTLTEIVKDYVPEA
ncbi:FliM/FliN family flagellar motor switch protein [Sulfitobacter sp. R18_1]|uniref:FliM/FliN family flagellar motor switch protein n=1 Tax=Sulfitobacter sp. R18_1 TaxID=2821104 RepID=UPI001ADCFF4B|nr:FliM/FliN family flagellar motor switch protein [Sulfitobacter sp. R18_1]MBO9428623.1 FliM/FliN family flagellar motor switch protein [Sulfitobacter sp. R18_1]